ncbi:MAG: hypothetical protein KIB08_03615 [Negativicoccus succinicivorans]|uniref:hypothetical protein n=1 Tax=Negativicoccus succinicivorans TaxID=620903 RepID=UPI0026EF5A03|nr:hypothetical protein [Negativicoccus succinicivorans]MBS5887599.1 hypothetical protein [Negativicoccus succinicivorans]MDU2417120.1 hypothetical protein [Negativicoccus succinicivorans]
MSKVTTYVDYRRTDFDNGWERGDRRATRGGLLLCAKSIARTAPAGRAEHL